MLTTNVTNAKWYMITKLFSYFDLRIFLEFYRNELVIFYNEYADLLE